MAFCTHCGQSVKDTANFCGQCGHVLSDAPLAIGTPSTAPVEPPLSAPPARSSDGGAQPDVDIPGNPWIGERPRLSNQALEPGELFSPKPNTSPAARSGSRGKLILFSVLFAAAGLALILLVAPELTDKWTWLWNTWEETTPEYWMAMVGGGVCLLLAGIFLLKAITTEAR